VGVGRDEGADRYLDLLERCLTRDVFSDEEYAPFDHTPGGQRTRSLKWRALRPVLDRLRGHGLMLMERSLTTDHRRHRRAMGWEWAPTAETTVGLRRLHHVRECVRTALTEDVPGDLIEAGAGRGGVCILMRAALAAYGDATRRVWVADSFEGPPGPDPAGSPLDRLHHLWTRSDPVASEHEVRASFERYGLLDDRVRFLPGWFRETIPAAPIEHLAVARVDAQLYASTIDALTGLYPKVSPGGFVIVDRYRLVVACEAAVDDYRREQGISEPIMEVDDCAVFWRKSAS
jgi:O-methyltransferase